MSSKVDCRILSLWLVVGIIIVFALHFAAGLSYLAACGFVLLGLVCIFLNGLLAMWEDEQPGGFNNPRPSEEIRQKSDAQKKDHKA